MATQLYLDRGNCNCQFCCTCGCGMCDCDDCQPPASPVPALAETAVERTLPGHPVKDGAGYDCNCGACLSLPARRGEPLEQLAPEQEERAEA